MYLHYADMIANGYHRTMPCPFKDQGLLLNPNGDLHYCENSQKLGNVLDESAEALYFKAANLAHREQIKNETCPTCLSPCQVNVERDEAVHSVREVPEACVCGQARAGAPPRDAAGRRTDAMNKRRPVAPPSHPRCRRPDGLRHLESGSRRRSCAQAAGLDWRWAVAAFALVLVDRALMAYRWMVLLCALTPGSRPPFAEVLRIFFVSTFVGSFLPGVAGDVYRAYSLSRLRVRRRAVRRLGRHGPRARHPVDGHRRGRGARLRARNDCSARASASRSASRRSACAVGAAGALQRARGRSRAHD